MAAANPDVLLQEGWVKGQRSGHISKKHMHISGLQGEKAIADNPAMECSG